MPIEAVGVVITASCPRESAPPMKRSAPSVSDRPISPAPLAGS